MSSIEKELAGRMPAADPRPGWADLPMGAAMPEAGGGAAYQTGDWRSQRPVIDFSQCIQCFFCWVFCPDGSIKTEGRKVTGVDYYHCKGCGICAHECPKKCIAMVDEEAALREEAAAASQTNESGS